MCRRLKGLRWLCFLLPQSVKHKLQLISSCRFPPENALLQRRGRRPAGRHEPVRAAAATRRPFVLLRGGRRRPAVAAAGRPLARYPRRQEGGAAAALVAAPRGQAGEARSAAAGCFSRQTTLAVARLPSLSSGRSELPVCLPSFSVSRVSSPLSVSFLSPIQLPPLSISRLSSFSIPSSSSFSISWLSPLAFSCLPSPVSANSFQPLALAQKSSCRQISFPFKICSISCFTPPAVSQPQRPSRSSTCSHEDHERAAATR